MLVPEEAKLERYLWCECLLCEEEYSKNIKINPNCLHSYCNECIIQSSKTSMICPICHISLPSPLSALPPNYALQYWSIISPPETLILDLQNIFQKYCEECTDEKLAEENCEDCCKKLCKVCSNFIHTQLNHKNRKELKTSTEIPTTLQFHKCDFHNSDMKLYCVNCKEFVCTLCINERRMHRDHITKPILRYIDTIKDLWLQNIEDPMNNPDLEILRFFFAKYQPKDNRLKQINFNLAKLNKEIQTVSNLQKEDIENQICCLQSEIKEIEDHRLLCDRIKSHFELLNQFLKHYLQNLTPLSLSTYFELDNSSKRNNNNNKNDEEQTPKRIKDFFSKNCVIGLFTFFIRSFDESFVDKKSINSLPISPSNDRSEELQSKWNKMIQNNKLIEGKNLIKSFGSYGTQRGMFNRPVSIKISSKLNIIAIADYFNERVQLFDSDGNIFDESIIMGNGVIQMRGVVSLDILVKQKLLAVLSQLNGQILFYSIDYTQNFGKLHKSINDLDNPTEISSVERLDTILVCEKNKCCIHIFKLSTGQLIETKRLSFYPNKMDASYSANMLLISDIFNHNVHLFHIHSIDDPNMINITQYQSIEASFLKVDILRSPLGVAIHRRGNFFVVIDRYNDDLQFFSLSGKLICKFCPTFTTNPNFWRKKYFVEALDICVDKNRNFIVVTNISRHNITFFRSPLFNNSSKNQEKRKNH